MAATSPRLDVDPGIFDWALARLEAPLRAEVELKTKVTQWRGGKKKPTMHQLAEFAKRARVPFGFLLLPTPTETPLDLVFFRKGSQADINDFPIDVRQLIRDTQARQAWTADYLRELGRDPLAFVGSATVNHDPEALAAKIRAQLKYTSAWTLSHSSWNSNRLALIERLEEAGVFVAASGAVGQNTSRPIDPEVLDGFALADEYAPFIYVNSKAYIAKQIFTLLHELVHLWLGRSVAVQLKPEAQDDINETERFCNRVAAEVLVPGADLREALGDHEVTMETLEALARRFRVSRLVILYRLSERRMIARDDMLRLHDRITGEYAQRKASEKDDSGGDFFNSAPVRISKRFVSIAREAFANGELSLQEAASLTAVRGKSLRKLLEG